MLVDMHAHVIPGSLEAVGASEDHRGPRIGPCHDDEHARLLENDRGMQFKAIDAFYLAERRLEEMDSSGVDAEVVSPMPPLLDYALTGAEGLELSRRVNEFIAELTRTDPGRLMGMGMVPMQAPELAPPSSPAFASLGSSRWRSPRMWWAGVARRRVRGVLVRGRAARDARVHPRDARRLRRAPAGRSDPDRRVRGRRRRAAGLRGDHHERARRAPPAFAPGVQPRRRRLPDDAPARDDVLGQDVERGATLFGHRGRVTRPSSRGASTTTGSCSTAARCAS